MVDSHRPSHISIQGFDNKVMHLYGLFSHPVVSVHTMYSSSADACHELTNTVIVLLGSLILYGCSYVLIRIRECVHT